mgnify:CR=1 FL=1
MSLSTTSIEQTVSAVVERLLARYRLLMDEMGDKPLGFVEGNKWEKLEIYLDQLRPNPLAWQGMVDYYIQRYQGNRPSAVIEVIKEATALERSLALEGNWDRTSEDYPRAVQQGASRVRAEMFARRMTPAIRAQQAVEREAAKPAALVGPEVLPVPLIGPPFGALAPEGVM